MKKDITLFRYQGSDGGERAVTATIGSYHEYIAVHLIRGDPKIKKTDIALLTELAKSSKLCKKILRRALKENLNTDKIYAEYG